MGDADGPNVSKMSSEGKERALEASGAIFSARCVGPASTRKAPLGFNDRCRGRPLVVDGLLKAAELEHVLKHCLNGYSLARGEFVDAKQEISKFFILTFREIAGLSSS